MKNHQHFSPQTFPSIHTVNFNPHPQKISEYTRGAIVIYNNILNNIINAHSINSFKTKLKEFIFESRVAKRPNKGGRWPVLAFATLFESSINDKPL